MEENDPRKLARELEREGDKLEERSDALAHEIADTRQDWRRMREDKDEPGAPPPEDEEPAKQP
jgi:hypothetical protein